MQRLVIVRHDSWFAAAMVITAVFWAAPALAQDVETRPWSEILLVVGHDIGLSLPDAYVEGKAVAVTPEALEIEVQRTSNAKAYPKGSATIARPLISVILMRKDDGRAPRAATRTIGRSAVFAGLLGLGWGGGFGGILRGAGVQIGAATAGAAIGRRFDKRQIDVVIRIVPEN